MKTFDDAELVPDSTPIEAVLGYLVRRAGRLCSHAEAAYLEAASLKSVTPAAMERLNELGTRCATSARECRALSEAVRELAPYSSQDQECSGYARFAATFDKLAYFRLGLLRGLAQSEANK